MNKGKPNKKLMKHLRKMVNLNRSNFGSMRDLIKLNKLLENTDKSKSKRMNDDG